MTMHDFQEQHQTVFHATMCFFKTMYEKKVIGFSFCDSETIKVSIKVISLS